MAFCKGRLRGTAEDLPVKGAKKPRRVEERRVYLLFHKNAVALRRRSARGLLAGLWEYPNELSPASLPLEWGITPLSNEYGCQAKHIFSHIEWHMTAQIVEAASPELPEGGVWADRAALERDYAVPNAFQAFAGAVEARL